MSNALIIEIGDCVLLLSTHWISPKKYRTWHRFLNANGEGVYVRWGPLDDLITNLVRSSGRTQRGDHRDGGPVWGGPCLVHHPAAKKGAAVVRKKKRYFHFGLWDPCGPLIFGLGPYILKRGPGGPYWWVWSWVLIRGPHYPSDLGLLASKLCCRTRFCEEGWDL